jgi:streptomycin 6-kinase
LSGPLQLLPEKVQRNVASLGEVGRAWLAGLPRYIAEIERRWAIKVGLSRRGSEAFVAEARTLDGQDVVLKIVIPGIDPTRQELRTLRAAMGMGYARLIRADEAENTLLLERLGAQLHELDIAADRQIEIICATLREAWMPLPGGQTFATGAEKATELGQIIESNWTALGKPCSERTIDLALTYVERRRLGFDPRRSVLAHGDAHQWNTLSAPGSKTGFKFVDPDGAFAERAFDLAIPMREWGNEMPNGDRLHLGRHRCRLLAELTGVEQQAIWEWGVIQCVSNGLLLMQIGLDGPASVSLAMADAWAAGPLPTLAADDRRHPVRRAARRSGLERLALKVMNRGNRREVSTIAQAVHIDDRACCRRHFRNGRGEDTAPAADKKIAGAGSEAVILYQRPVIRPNLE